MRPARPFFARTIFSYENAYAALRTIHALLGGTVDRMIRLSLIHEKKKESADRRFPFSLSFALTKVADSPPKSQSACKPGSVHFCRDHLSLRRVTASLEGLWPSAAIPFPTGRRRLRARKGVASDRVYRGAVLPWHPVSFYLAVPPLPVCDRRYISVALVLKSPSADVIRYPCPAKPGLSSR